MRYAVADTGSNTIRLGVYDYENGQLKQLCNTAVFANLAGFIHDGVLTPDGICAAEAAIKKHQETAAEFGCRLNVFATAAIRNAKNTEEICNEIKMRTGAAVDVLTGEEEALFSFAGAAEDFPCADGVMADVGGGSSEVIVFSNKQPISTLSVPWGSLKAYKAFVSGSLPTEDEICAIQEAIAKTFAAQPRFCGVVRQNLCIVGGGVRASTKLAKIFLNETALTVQAVNKMLKMITENPEHSKNVIDQATPKRALTIAPAMAIYSAVGAQFASEQIFVSDKGIKEGYILKKLL